LSKRSTSTSQATTSMMWGSPCSRPTKAIMMLLCTYRTANPTFFCYMAKRPSARSALYVWPCSPFS
jgi:hypothetical protein